MKKYILSFVLLSLVFFSFLPAFSAAADPIVQCSGPKGSCTLDDLVPTIEGAIDYVALQLAPLIGIFMLIVGAVIFLFSGGNPQLKSIGKKVIVSTLVGLFVVLAAWQIVETILNVLGYSS